MEFIRVIDQTPQTKQIIAYLGTDGFANKSNVEKLREMFVVERDKLRTIERTFYANRQHKLRAIGRQNLMLRTITKVGKAIKKQDTVLFL